MSAVDPISTEEAPNTELSICTVAYDSSDWIRLNSRLTQALNPNMTYRWIIVENSRQESLKRVSSDIGNFFTILKGNDSEHRPYAAASYHHGAGLNLGLSAVKTRFLLVLDPDFYIVRNNWMSEVLDYMERESVTILGVPWHPDRYKKWRYFPCAHCTFFDLSRVEKRLLDFRPDYDQYPRKDKRYSRRLKKIIKIIDPLKFRERHFIGHSADTGYRVFKQFQDGAQRGEVECFTPVFSPSIFRKFYNAPFKDELSLIPQQTNYYSTRSFVDINNELPDFRKLGCEEFLWENTPFGFHVRSFPKRHKATNSLPLILRHLEHFIAASG